MASSAEKIDVGKGDPRRNLTHCSTELFSPDSGEHPAERCECDGNTVHSPGGPFGVYQRSLETQGRPPPPLTKATPTTQSASDGAASNLEERGSGLRARGPVQDFNALRDQCLNDGSLFEDPEFPAEDESIFFSKRPPRPFEWRRPREIVANPQLFVGGASRFDVQQGEIGNCWLLAAAANLTLNTALFHQVVPEDQGFEEKYAGIFHFRFWQFGRWVDVVIDDRLPTRDGELVFMHSTEENEFWSALLEKAYAKLYGSYEALDGGTTCEAMEDFTGGVSEMFEVSKTSEDVFKIMTKAHKRSSLLGCSIQADRFTFEARTPEGLVKGHAYSVTNIKSLRQKHPSSNREIALIRLRNPWGNGVEWNGAWSDRSPEWDLVTDREREEIGLSIDYDGEFWMSEEDFKKNFHYLEICNLNPDPLVEEDMGGGLAWEVSMFEGEWVRGVTAGGCINFPETFGHNPQYRITLKDQDEDDDEEFCTVIIALMQKNRRSLGRMGAKQLYIGITVYKLQDPDNLPKPLPASFFANHHFIFQSKFFNQRQLTCRLKLTPGAYCVVPSTFDPNEEGEFILRVFTDTKNHMEEIDEEVGMKHMSSLDWLKPISNSRDKMADEAVRECFLEIAGEDKEVDWKELQTILNNAMKAETHNMGFSKDVCRSMIALMDGDKTGKLGFIEFKTLWNDISHWKNVFKSHDKDGSGTLSAFELRQALNSVGYTLNNNILNILIHRYGTKDGSLEFDDYIMSAIKLKAVINMFKRKVIKNTKKAEFTLEEWVENMLYS